MDVVSIGAIAMAVFAILAGIDSTTPMVLNEFNQTFVNCTLFNASEFINLTQFNNDSIVRSWNTSWVGWSVDNGTINRSVNLDGYVEFSDKLGNTTHEIRSQINFSSLNLSSSWVYGNLYVSGSVIANSGPHIFGRIDSDGAGVVYVNYVTLTTDGDMDNTGFGPAYAFNVKDSDYAGTLGYISVVTNGAENRGRMGFRTSNAGALSERMSLSHDGKLGLGDTSPSYQLELSSDSAGKPSTSTWSVVSDERTKDDIVEYVGAKAKLLSLPHLESFRYNGVFGTPENVSGVGWTAQQVRESFPSAVRNVSIVTEKIILNTKTNDTIISYINDSILSIDYHELFVAGLQVIKEQQEEIDLLKSWVCELDRDALWC